MIANHDGPTCRRGAPWRAALAGMALLGLPLSSATSAPGGPRTDGPTSDSGDRGDTSLVWATANGLAIDGTAVLIREHLWPYPEDLPLRARAEPFGYLAEEPVLRLIPRHAFIAGQPTWSYLNDTASHAPHAWTDGTWTRQTLGHTEWEQVSFCIGPAQVELIPGHLYTIDVDWGEIVLDGLRFEPADVNLDGKVGPQDIVALLNYLAAQDVRGDFNADGYLDSGDILAFLGVYAG